MKYLTIAFWTIVLSVTAITFVVTRLVTSSPKIDSDQVCYEPYGQPVTPEHLLQYTTIKVHYLTEPLLDDNGEEYDGLATWILNEARTMSFCEIWIPVPMQTLGDADMDTMGHELLHCLGGEFHPE